MKQYIEETCEVICEDNGRKFVADILNFRAEQNITISLEKSIRIELKWNRKVYEGFFGGKSFVTDGPVIRNVRQGR